MTQSATGSFFFYCSISNHKIVATNKSKICDQFSVTASQVRCNFGMFWDGKNELPVSEGPTMCLRIAGVYGGGDGFPSCDTYARFALLIYKKIHGLGK